MNASKEFFFFYKNKHDIFPLWESLKTPVYYPVARDEEQSHHLQGPRERPLLFEIERIQFHIKEVGGSIVIKPGTGIDPIKEPGPGFYGSIRKILKKILNF